MEYLTLESNRELNKFIDKNLQPDEEYSGRLRKCMNFLASFLKEDSKFTVRETLKAGSAGKGTVVAGKADLDVVVYSKYKDLDEFKERLPDDIKYLKKQVKLWSLREPGKVKLEGNTAHAVKLKVRPEIQMDFVDVDLLPAFDILKQGTGQVQHSSSQSQVKSKKKKKQGIISTPKVKPIPKPVQLRDGYSSILPSEREYASVSFAPLQIAFVQQQRPNVKNLIRLVKYWRKTVDFEAVSKKYSKNLATSYVFELLTIYAWERAGSPDTFNTNKGFMAVLKILKDYRNVDVSWNENYNKDSCQDVPVKSHHRPLILDPAQPFNVCERFSGWQVLSDAAHSTLHCPLLDQIKVERKKDQSGRKIHNHSYDWM